MRFFAALAIFLAACATAPEGPSEPAPPTTPESTPPPVARSENVAVAGLMESARADAAAGKLSTAAASIERALRIEPRNPRLWQELARVRLQQTQFVQAENMAARSNSYAAGDNALRAENWRLIAQAREARGDADGARSARESAEQFSPK
ncbi:MAG TPA: tetratricopeptide repeat protein [Burkholderiales bacterium]|jgi:cytochrome c-type biogenesis protein CcmH/NrfG|nr:tetratricopeptide repeat protein [Burkholderiales bacterium]